MFSITVGDIYIIIIIVVVQYMSVQIYILYNYTSIL